MTDGGITMEINGKNYGLAQLREKMPRYEIFFAEKIAPGSQEDKLDKEPIGTTNPNLHMRFDSSKVVVRGEGEVFDRIYTFLGRIGVKIYSSKRKFLHDDDIDIDEIP